MAESDGLFSCPRCGGQIPNSRTPGAYMGAMSRTSRRVEVCSACGLHEAFLGYRRSEPVEEEWPVAVPPKFYR